MKKEHNNYNGGNNGRPQHNEGPSQGGSERGGTSSGARQGHQDSRHGQQSGHQQGGSDKCPTCKNVRPKGQDVR